jgi:thioredoxin 1
MADNVKTDEFDQQVLQSDQAVLVDFWAEWCGPCHAIAPVLDQIADERSNLKVVKLNIDEEPAIAQRYGVMSIPTLILFKDGEPQAAAIGAMPKAMLEERLGLAGAAAGARGGARRRKRPRSKAATASHGRRRKRRLSSR